MYQYIIPGLNHVQGIVVESEFSFRNGRYRYILPFCNSCGYCLFASEFNIISIKGLVLLKIEMFSELSGPLPSPNSVPIMICAQFEIFGIL